MPPIRSTGQFRRTHAEQPAAPAKPAQSLSGIASDAAGPRVLMVGAAKPAPSSA
jgi:hypothetical protein